ncbi:MAG: GNAT family N-acetyltransferase [Eubacteriales bacterium]|jgi:predicted acetyltransferase
MLIRPIRPDEAAALEKLRAAAFSFKADPEHTRPIVHETLGAYDDGVLLASITIRPYACNWCGEYLPALGVGGVSTMPLARRAGAIRKLFGELDRLAAERGWAWGMLYPFSYPYYRQFGYERLDPPHNYTIPLPSFDCVPRCSDGVLYDGSQADALLAIHRRYADTHNLMALRDNANAWDATPERSLRYTYLHRDPSGTFDAYVTLTYAADAIEVSELAYTSPASLTGVLGILRLFEGQRKQLRFPALPATSPVIGMLSRYEITERSIYNGVMGRVLDTETLLRKNSYPDVSGHFTLTVHDALPSCAGTFTVAYANGHADVLRTDRPADVETDAPNLSRILLSGIGYTAEELPYLPNTRVLDTARAADFSRAFPRRSVHLMEHF